MDRWWQSWGELIAKRLALRWQLFRATGNAEATLPQDEVGSGPPRTGDGESKRGSPEGDQK